MTVTTAAAAIKQLQALGRAKRSKSSAWFFKTGPGQYAEGDKFLGVAVPQTRALLRECEFDLATCEELLQSDWHEARLLALLAMVRLYERGNPAMKARVFRSYVAHTNRINNWDLVDSSAAPIVGAHLAEKSHARLTRWAKSKSLWERRIAMIATYYDITQGKPAEALRVATLLLRDDHDLIHKAVGWMLREVGKRCDTNVLRTFLKKYAATMPRTALRYAIEHFSPAERARWLRAR